MRSKNVYYMVRTRVFVASDIIVMLYPIDKLSFEKLDRVIVDDEYEMMRRKLAKEQEKVDQYNKALTEKWKTLSPLQRIEYHVRPDLIRDYQEIVERAKSLGLSEEKIVQVLISEQGHDGLFDRSFDGDYDRIPLHQVSDQLSKGPHIFSVQVKYRC